MGQYYTPVLLKENEEPKLFYSHHYGNGLKLMEHSWLGNFFVAVVLNELVNNPHRVYWLGDYAEEGDFKEGAVSLTKEEISEYNSSQNYANRPCPKEWKFGNAIVLNHTKKTYLILPKINKEEYQVCPIPLLTAVGNGKGGGDYFGPRSEEVGIWAGNTLEVVFEKEEIPSGYEEDFFFFED